MSAAICRIGVIKSLARNATKIQSSRGLIAQRRSLISLNNVLSRSKFALSTFESTYISPVNKFDLSSGGNLVLNSACAHFSTAFDGVQSDEISEDDVEETTMEKRWSAPISQTKQSCSIFIVGESLVCSEDEIAALFSKFGKVVEVDIPLKEKYIDSNDQYHNKYKYAFVTFENEDSMHKALDSKNLQYNDNGIEKSIEIKERTSQKMLSNAMNEQKRTLVLSNLPMQITIQEIYEHMKKYGEIEVINIVFSTSLRHGEASNYAYILFASQNHKELALEDSHVFHESIATVSPYRRRKILQRNRSRKVMIENLTEDLGEEAIKNYLATYGNINKVTMLRTQSGEFRGIAIGDFSDAKDVWNATSNRDHNINDHKVTIRALGASFI